MGMEATADTNGFKTAIADPTTGACSYAPVSDTPPALGDACTVQGSVIINIQNWFDDSPDWVMYCDTSNQWATIAKAKKKTTWELAPDANRAWVRIDVDSDNKNIVPLVPDSPTSWLKGEASGITTVNTKCTDPEPTGWAHGGSLFICIHGLTNQEMFIGYICATGIAEDTPQCGGHVGLNEGQISSMSADCPTNG